MRRKLSLEPISEPYVLFCRINMLMARFRTRSPRHQANDDADRLVFGKNSFGTFFGRVTGAEKWLRRITGISVLLVGVYITLQQIYHV